MTTRQRRALAARIWLAGMALTALAIACAWPLGIPGVTTRLGPGNFGTNLLLGLGLFSATSVLWGLAGKWLAHHELRAPTAVAIGSLAVTAIWLLFSGGANFGLLSLGLGLATLFFCLVVSIFRREVGAIRELTGRLFFRVRAWNGLFYALLLALLVIHNGWLLFAKSGNDLGPALSAAFGRLATQVVIVSGVFFLLRVVKLSGPPFLKYVVWALAGLTPAFVLADLQISVFWNKNLLEFLNSLTDSGHFDFDTELRATGLKVPAWLAVICIGIIFCISAALSVVLWRFSERLRLRVSPAAIAGIGLLGFIAVTAEQGLTRSWKGLTAWKAEHQLFDLHVSAIRPPFGLANFEVEFADTLPLNLKELERPEGLRPDIHILMVETLRADAIDPVLTPVMARLKRDEAQSFGDTYSTSNGTHLSWFGFFHSRLPVFWTRAMEEEDFKGAATLRILKSLGYEVRVRAGCELSYKAMGPLNFGKDYGLADRLIQSGEGQALGDLGGAEADERNISELEAELLESRRDQPMLFFTALESPHYNYYWSSKFNPPLEDYDDSPKLLQRPTPGEVERVKNRYKNSVAYIDSLVGRYVETLKAAGTYSNSLIIVTGDHGEEFQERGGWFHTSSLEPEQTEVPLIIKWPDAMGRGPRHEAVSHLDVMPSILDMLGYPEAVRTQLCIGRSLLTEGDERPIFRATAYPGKSRECLLLSHAGREAAFYWPRYWEADTPSEMTLLRFQTGGDERLTAAKLKELVESHFPGSGRFLRLRESQ